MRSGRWDIRIVDLAGLPGTGKTTICRLLGERHEISRLVWVNRYNQSRYRLAISLPFVPVTLVRYRRVFRTLFSALGTVSVRQLLSIFSVLNTFVVECLLARLEAVVRNKTTVVFDGAFIQRGISVWLRSPGRVREDVWSAYVSHLPGTIEGVVLLCEPDEAVRRATARSEGIPAVFHRRMRSSGEGWLLDTYRQMYRLLRQPDLARHVNCVHIDAGSGAQQTFDTVSAKVRGTGQWDDVVVQ